MPATRRAVLYCLLVTATFYFLFFFGLTATGLLGPDEPRYAAIGREMARSGDWVTPRLWGEPWFEKPALIYWMTGLAFRAGLGEDLAPRLPVALMSVAFLLFYWWALRREFGARAACFATAMLATSAAWLSFSHVGVTDLPMAAAFSAAMLLGLRLAGRPLPDGRGSVGGSEPRALASGVGVGALLGLAVLAKGLVPLVLALPLVWTARRRLKELLHPAAMVAFLLVAAPWYVLCALANGSSFLDEFFVKHHFSRVWSEALQHPQPFWFYVPVLLAGLFPWTPLVVLLFRRSVWQDPRRRFLLAWVGFGLLLFSLAVNKLPGYLLPLVPAVCALAGLELAEAKGVRWPLAACALLLALVPLVAAVLPGALLEGLRRAAVGEVRWAVSAPAGIVAVAVWWLEARGRRVAAVAVLVGAMAAGVLWFKVTTFPVLDRAVSARAFWREIAPRAGEVCVEEANRGWLYGLNYYAITPLPECADQPRPWRLQQSPGTARLVPSRQP